MDLPAILLTFLAGTFLLIAPRELASIPLLLGASYMTFCGSADFGPFHFTSIRILVAVGIFRVLVKGERLAGGCNGLDRMIMAWGVWAVCSSAFHTNFAESLVYRMGMAYTGWGIYFLLRIFISDQDTVAKLFKASIIALVPIAIAMITESMTGRNFFSFLDPRLELSEIRGGHVRAQGPFSHSILAGTVGAVYFPMAIQFWKADRILAVLTAITAGSMVLTSHSSGPIMTMIILIGLGLWNARAHVRAIRNAAIVGVIFLNIFMNAPVYYLLARIDLTGNSSSWHRAALIDGAIEHFDEWWLGGTDYTRDWTPNAGPQEEHTDITNHYIKMGVLGGLPMMMLFIGTLAAGFSEVGEALRHAPVEQQRMIWTLGSILFGHAANMLSVAYFDASIFFLFFTLACIAAVRQCAIAGTESVSGSHAEFASQA